MNNKRQTHCEACRTELGEALIELPQLPLSECLFDEPTKLELIDQEFHVCTNCGHGQLGIVVDKNILYREYAFKTSEGLNKGGNEFITKMLEQLKNIDTIVDIGCNDLCLLKSLKGKVENLIGIDPHVKSEDDNIKILNKFVEDVNWNEYITDNTLVTSIHNIEHIESPYKLIKNMFNAVKNKTVFVFEFPCLESLVKHKRFDRIFHQHLHYFTIEAFQRMVIRLGGEVYMTEYLEDNWGAARIVFGKKRNYNLKVVRNAYDDFQKTMNIKAKEISEIKDEKIFGYGAVLTLPVLNYHLMNTLNHCNKFVDLDINKAGKYYPYLDNNIINGAKDLSDTNVVITAISFNDGIKKSIEKLNPKKIIELK